MSRRSPRSYISRTFPDAMRGRSETGGMSGRLAGLEDDDGDGPLGVGLVLVVGLVALDEARPKGAALGVIRHAGADLPALAALELDLGLGRRHEVVEPRGVLVGAALGGDDQEAVAVVQVDERRDARGAALAPDVVQQQHGRALHRAAEPAL